MTHYDLVAANQTKSWLVMLGFIIFVGGAATLMALGFGYDPSMIGWALVLAGFTSIGSYYFSDQIIFKK